VCLQQGERAEEGGGHGGEEKQEAERGGDGHLYDEKPGIQAIATTAPDLPQSLACTPTFTREFEYKRHGTVSLLGRIDLVTGKVHALVKDATAAASS